ncbi:MAG TPA: alpha-2-macroglobulin, partial [Niastella sp.]
RETIMPLWYGRWGKMIWPPYGQQEMEIAHGELTTDAKGEFHIQFKSIPDNKGAKKDQPTFYYKVYADVTDVAGETRSGNTDVAVAYQALKLNLQGPDKLHTDSLNRISISSTNLNDLFEKTTVTVSIHKLKTPDRVYRKRNWPQPDLFIFTQAEYYSLFPYDEYKDENQPAKWEKAEKVAERTDTTADGKPFAIAHSPLAPGWYVVEAITKDKYGEEVKDIKYVQLYNQNIISSVASGDVESGKTTVTPGEKATYQVNTTLDNVFVLHEVSKKDGKNRSFITLNKNSRSFELPVTEADRGGFGITIAFIKHNRSYTDYLQFDVPYDNKELSIDYETFRDKTLPGSEEKWKLKISG